MDGIQSLRDYLHNFQNGFSETLSEFARKTSVIGSETFAVLAYVVPSWISWTWRVYSECTIKEEIITGLFFHTQGQKQKPVLLFLHGDHSHPATLLPILDSCEEYTCYSIHLSYNDDIPELHRKVLDCALELITKKHEDSSIILVGHSKGAIESSYAAFVKEDERIRAVISIAGRLALPLGDESCGNDLRPTISKIQEAIEKRYDIPLYQIVAENDWNAPLKATRVRPDTAAIINNAYHLNILYFNETCARLHEFLKSAAS